MALAACTKDGAASLNPMSFTDQHSNAIIERLRYQRASGRFCDALIVVKDRKFNAHRMLLAAASPYFDAILRYNKIIKEKIIVNCENPVVFEVLLNYIYSGSVVIDRNIVTELLKLSNNLLIVRLKNHCVEYLERYIDVANCLNIRNLAMRYNLSELLKKASEFFDSNINGCLLENTDLLEYDARQLDELLKNPKYCDIIRPDVHLNFVVRWVGHKLLERESLFKELLTDCPFQQVSTLRLERMLDYNPFFAHSEISLYVILQEMHNIGMSIEKYEVQYRNLVKKYCQDKVSTSAPQFYAANVAGTSAVCFSQAGSSAPTQQDFDDANDAEIMDFTRNAGAGYSGSVDENFSSSSQAFHQRSMLSTVSEESSLSASSAPVYLEQRTIGNAQQQQRTDEADASRPALKLRISLAGISQDSNDTLSQAHPTKRRLLYGLNHYRKKQKLMLRRRGRPPKIRPTRFTDGSVGDSAIEEPESCFYEFADENVHVLDVFDEEDEVDPDGSTDNMPMNQTETGIEIQCEYCVFRGRTENQLRNHFAQFHSKNILYVCNVCQFECKWNRQFYDHMRQHFPGPVYQCDGCFYTTERIHVFLSHRLTHTDEKPFKCTDCDFRCRNRSNLVTHHRLHSGERPFECPECHKQFAVRATFEQHVAAHSDERPFVCDECNFATKYQSHLISHRRIHSGDLFRCEVEGCDYSSPKKSQLAAHLRTHLAVRSHKCRICNRSFIEKSHLIRHERIHLADKPFKCNHCDYASSRRDKLKEHILKHHNNVAAGGDAAAVPNASTSSSLALTSTNRRRYRRVRQINQIAAQVKLNPPNASNFFRPIPLDVAMRDKEQQQQQQQQQFLAQHRQRSGSESVIPAVDSGSTVEFLAQQREAEISIASANVIMRGNAIRHQHHQAQHSTAQQHQQQRQQQQQTQTSDVTDYQSIITQHQHQLMSNNNERFQQQLNDQQNQMIVNRPCSASLPQKDSYGESSSLSPSCYSLRDFQLHHNQHHSGTHHLGHHQSVDGAFNQTAAPTPDTDLSTPGPHLDNLRNPHSVSNLFNVGERGDNGPGTVASFGSHQLSIDKNQLQAAVAAAAAAAAVTRNDQQQQMEQDAVQRPMSLPNYGGLMQQFQMQQMAQQDPQQQQTLSTSHVIDQPAPYYNLMGLNASQLVMQAQQQQQHGQLNSQMPQQQQQQQQQPWS